MSDSVQMPALGESVTEGTVTRWLKQIGEQIEIDEPLLEVSTDKVDTEVPSPFAGVLEEILVGEDETVDVGTPLAKIGSGATSPQAPAPATVAPTVPTPAPVAETPTPAPVAEQPTVQAPVVAEATPIAQTAPAAPVAPVAPTAPAAPTAPTSESSQTVDMPALGESVTEGTVTRWLKQVGETIALDEALLEVSTDKVDTEVPSPLAGTVQEILVAEDETVEVGTPLARIGTLVAGAAAQPSALPAVAPPPPSSAPAAPVAAPVLTPPEPAPSTAPNIPAPTPAPISAPIATTGVTDGAAPAYVTPLVRKLATEQGVDLGGVTGSGIGGRIRKQDVLNAAEQAKVAAAASTAPAPVATSPSTPAAAKPSTTPSPLRGTTEKMTRLRKLVAQRMVESLQTSAQLTTVVEVDMTRVARLRARAKEDFKAREGVSLTFLPFFALAALEGLKAHPKLNASIDGDQVIYHGQENLGIAVDTERGLVVPVIKDAGDLNIGGIARKIADLATRTRGNKVGPDELSGGTFTITNTGSGGALFDTPIIAQPQVAILGTGTIVKRPVVATDDEGAEVIAIRSMVYLSLSYDHRLVDGADGARYLMTLKQRLEEGAFEADLGL